MQPSFSLLLTLAASPFAYAVPRNHPNPGKWHPPGSGGSSTTTSTISTPASTPVVASATPPSPSSSSSSTTTTPTDCSANTGQDSLLYSGPYTINNNLWGMSTGIGSQCLDAASGSDPVAWSTTWSWENTASDQTSQHYIKSYANAHNPSITCQALSDYKSIPTSWTWSYDVTQTAIVADVAYDVFFGGSACVGPGGTHPIEVMIWLGAYGKLGPIGSPSDGGSATPVGSIVSGGIAFDLYSGKNTDTGSTCYSFIVSDGTLENSYSGDLLPFFKYLEKFERELSGMLLQSIQAGTEAVTGSATFSTGKYSISYT